MLPEIKEILRKDKSARSQRDFLADAKNIVAEAKAKGFIRSPGVKVPVQLAGTAAAACKNVRVQFVDVTPDMARAWLTGNNLENRKPRQTTIDSYARDMRNGAWQLNHQGLAFDVNDTLIDGQHRLHALVEANVILPFLISTGWPAKDGKAPSVMDTVDVGLGRSISDLLGLQHGISEAKYVVTAANVIAKILRTGTRKLSVDLVLKITGVFKDGVRHAVENKITVTGLRSAGVLGAVAFAHALAPKKVEQFYSLLNTGAGLQVGDPILVLRNYLLGQNSSHCAVTKGNTRELAHATLTHIRAHIDGERLKSLTNRKESVNWFIAKQAGSVAKVDGWLGAPPPPRK